MTFGEKLARLRRENNYTQEQLADILGVTRQSISKWESDIAYPETDKLIKIGKLFDCTVDYLLNDDAAERQTSPQKTLDGFCGLIKRQIRERKSERMIFGMPLYHIGRDARGFFAVGLRARGVFSIGFLSRGVFSLGLLSLGLFSWGVLSLGLLAVGVLALGPVAIGAIALGFLALGAVSVGIVSVGALSVGCFSAGALAIGKYAAVGDRAYAMIAIGKSVAEGSEYCFLGGVENADVGRVRDILARVTPQWLGWAREIFKLFILL